MTFTIIIALFVVFSVVFNLAVINRVEKFENNIIDYLKSQLYDRRAVLESQRTVNESIVNLSHALNDVIDTVHKLEKLNMTAGKTVTKYDHCGDGEYGGIV